MINYFYTLVHKASELGGTFWRAMFFEWPNDVNAYVEPEYNIMVGPALKLSAETLNLEATEHEFYFPQGRWCHIYDKKAHNNLPCFQVDPAEG